MVTFALAIQAHVLPELQHVPHPGLRWQDTRSGGQMEQVKSVWSGQTLQNRETSVAGCIDKLAADQIVLELNEI